MTEVTASDTGFNEDAGVRATRKPHRGGRLLIVAAVGATILIPFLLGGQNLLATTLQFPKEGYAALFALMLVSWLGRTLKLQLLLRPFGLRPGFAHMLGIALATDFAFVSTPGGIGGYAASIFYLRRAGTSLSGAATVTAADQGLDVVFFVLALLVAGFSLVLSPVPETLSRIAFGTSALVMLIFLSALIAHRNVTAWLFGENFLIRRWPKLRSKQRQLRRSVALLKADARRLLSRGRLFLCVVFVLTALQQLARYAVLWTVLVFLGHAVPFMLTLLLQELVLHAALWTGIPAGGGAAEIGLTTTLMSWVPNSTLATVLLLWRMATLYLCLVAGGMAIVWLSRNRSLKHAANDSPTEQ